MKKKIRKQLGKLSLSNTASSGSSDGASTSTGYQRLAEDATNHELTFYNDDGSSQKVLVEKDLCASDLCQLLALKNRKAGGLQWSIVEHWTERGLERCLEDHEKVLDVYRFMEGGENKFIFRQDPKKYDVFLNPRQYLQRGLISSPSFSGLSEEHSNILLQNILTDGGKDLRVACDVWLMEREGMEWDMVFLAQKHGELLMSKEGIYVAELLRYWSLKELREGRTNKDVENANTEESSTLDEDSLYFKNRVTSLGMVSGYNIYTTINARHHQRAPFGYGITLRSPDKQIDAASNPGLVCLSFRCEEERAFWLIVMRLAKYGRLLKENYLAYKNKNTNLNVNEFSSLSASNESLQSRVAMDFTGGVGRIVDDPQEVRAIETAEGQDWARRHAMNQREARAAAEAGIDLSLAFDSGIHRTQPWFYINMTREQATLICNRSELEDGSFLVRESRSSPNCCVLTYRFGGRAYHQQIKPILDSITNRVCCTLDTGVTKFWDLQQLVQFYQLNSLSLHTRLTHYIVHNSAGIPIAVRRS